MPNRNIGLPGEQLVHYAFEIGRQMLHDDIGHSAATALWQKTARGFQTACGGADSYHPKRILGRTCQLSGDSTEMVFDVLMARLQFGVISTLQPGRFENLCQNLIHWLGGITVLLGSRKKTRWSRAAATPSQACKRVRLGEHRAIR